MQVVARSGLRFVRCVILVCVCAFASFLFASDVPNAQASCNALEELSRLGGPVDAIVVGSGLAGMTASLSLLDRGARVVLIEKQAFLGGNSGKASSGINSAPAGQAEAFVADTTKSAAHLAREDLIAKLVAGSAGAVEWLKERVKVDLSMTVQLGGHSEKRTFRPSTGFVGAEVVFALGNLLKEFAAKKPNQFRILTNTKWTALERRNEAWQATLRTNETSLSVHAPSFVIASGGFGHDIYEADSFLKKHRPDLIGFPTTLGTQTTGDGVRIARDIGAKLVDMESVQVHPTGFVDPAKPAERTKTLAAELLRGVGGLMLDSKGQRFTDELGTRKAVTADMLRLSEAGLSFGNQSFAMVLNAKAAAKAERHVPLYTKKGLFVRVQKLQGLAEHLGVPTDNLRQAFSEYNAAAQNGKDAFGRTVFPLGHWPIDMDEDFVVGYITPVIHYTMGGVAIDAEGRVLSSKSETPEQMPGLYAIGEASGGVHGDNRLGGNSLLECAVFGRQVGGSIPIHSDGGNTDDGAIASKIVEADAEVVSADNVDSIHKELRTIGAEELAGHTDEEKRTWITLYGQVYDITDFLDEHPGGKDSLLEVVGTEATEMFESVHNQELLESMGFEPIGTYTE